jgi:hypothetical protein
MRGKSHFSAIRKKKSSAPKELPPSTYSMSWLPDADILPELLAAKLATLREKPGTPLISLCAMGFADIALPRLYEILHHSDCAVERLDLSFNSLTSDGLLQLCATLGREGIMAHTLTSIIVGGNDVTAEAQDAAVELMKRQRPDVTLDFVAHVHGATPLMTVGNVFTGSPASIAGLQKGDIILIFGVLRTAGTAPSRAFKSEAERHMEAVQHFTSISESLKPLIAAAVNKDGENTASIDVIVARAGVGHVRLTFKPGRWSGEGLVGAKVTAVEHTKAKKQNQVPTM